MRSKVLELAASLSKEDIEAYLTYVEQLARAPVDVIPSQEMVESYKTDPEPDYLQLIADMEARLQDKIALMRVIAPAGVAGKDGKDGKNGKDGKDGAVGKAGKDGKDGLDGKDGISVVDASVDFDNRLTITLSDGSVIDAGQITVNEGSVIQTMVKQGGESMGFSGVVRMLDKVSTPSVGQSVSSQTYTGKKTFQVIVEGVSPVSTVVAIECSNDGNNWLVLGTIAIAPTDETVSSDGFASEASWAFHRAKCTAMSASSTVTVLMGA